MQDGSRKCVRKFSEGTVECWMRFVRLFEREGEAFLRRIVTVDETWISLDTNQKKEQSAIWKTPSSLLPKKFKVSPSTKKQLIIVFFLFPLLKGFLRGHQFDNFEELPSAG